MLSAVRQAEGRLQVVGVGSQSPHAPFVERRVSPPAGAGGFVAVTLAQMQHAMVLFMNVVEEEFSEVRVVAQARRRPGTSSEAPASCSGGYSARARDALGTLRIPLRVLRDGLRFGSHAYQP